MRGLRSAHGQPALGPRQRGSVTIIAAAVLFLAGALSLVAVDILRALQAKARAQTAADAAALAAAQEIALPSGITPEQAAADYAGRNGATLVACACAEGTAEAIVEVEVPVVLVFLGGDRTVKGEARAVIEGATILQLQAPEKGSVGRMARDAPSGSSRAPPPPRGGGLYTGQASPPARLPAGAPFEAGHM